MTGQHAAIVNKGVFIGNNAVQKYIFTGERILVQYRIFNLGILPYFHSAEKYGVFNFAFDDAAVGDE